MVKILRRGRPAIGNAGGTVDPRQRWAVVSQSGCKTVVAPDQPHQYAVAVVTDIAAEGLRPASCCDKGRTPPLHFTANADLHPVHAFDLPGRAVRRRFSIFICSSLLRSTHTRACVGHTSMLAGPLSRWKQRSHLLASAFFRHDVQSGAAMAGSPGAPPPPSPRTGRRQRRFCSRCNAPCIMDKAFIAADGAVRSYIGAGGVFTLTAGGRRGNIDPFDHVNTRLKGVRRQGGAILMFLMGYHAGHFASATADLLASAIMKRVHPFLQQVRRLRAGVCIIRSNF